MRLTDLISMCIGNLRRRKLRTVLTVLGVVIGTASVVLMTSFGLGMAKLNQDMFESFGSLTMIQVYESYNGDSSVDRLHLTDESVEQFKLLEHVKTVSPQLESYAILKQGLYECSINICGVTQEYLKDIELNEGGRLPSSDELELLMGNNVITQFYNTKTHEGYWDNQEIPDVDFKKPLFVIFDTDAYYSSQVTTDSENSVDPPKKYVIDVCGVTAGSIDDYNQYSFNMYTDIDALKAQLKRIYGKNPIPGQPTTKKGKALPYFCYNSINVYCDSMDDVSAVQKQINELGFEATSNMEWLEQSQKQSDMIQLILGGIGAISLLVAAIGIANTMMMSIYERTKEIGIMKVLGCDINQIRNMFLMESGFIGLIGGTMGVALSYIVGIIVNKLDLAQQFTGMRGDISVIPVWLALAAVAFAIVISMAAGIAPAIKAMKLSPLMAIKNE